jgi:Right handed beta helix region/Pel9A-like, right handed beta helix region
MRMQTVQQRALSAMIFTGFVLGCLWSPWAATAATYYTATNGSDANPGSQSQPFRTIKKGLSVLASGDTLYLRGGTYDEAIRPTVGAIPNGTSWDSATTIAGYPGETAILVPTVCCNVVQLGDGGQFGYMIFDNLTLDGRWIVGVIYVAADTHHIRFSNCDITNSGGHSVFGGGAFNEVINSRIHDGRAYGFYYSGHDSLFDNNDVFNHGGYAYHIYDSGATNINNNIIRNNRIFRTSGVVVSHGSNNQARDSLVYENFLGILVDYECIDCRVSSNMIFRNTNNAINVGTRAFHAIIENNILFENEKGIADSGVGTILINNVDVGMATSGP